MLRTDETVDIKYNVPTQLEAPISNSEVVGSISYFLNGDKIKEYSVITTESIQEKDLSWYFSYIAKLYLGIKKI